MYVAPGMHCNGGHMFTGDGTVAGQPLRQSRIDTVCRASCLSLPAELRFLTSSSSRLEALYSDLRPQHARRDNTARLDFTQRHAAYRRWALRRSQMPHKLWSRRRTPGS